MAILTLLSLLAAGAVVLALYEAPRTPNLVVHNGAGELALANQVTLRFASTSSSAVETITYRAPDRASVLVVNGGQVITRRSVRDPTVATQLFGPFRFLLKVNGFAAAQGGRFIATLPASQVVAPSQAASVRGSVHLTATVRGGVLVRLLEAVNLQTAAGSENQTGLYCVTRFNNTAVKGC